MIDSSLKPETDNDEYSKADPSDLLYKQRNSFLNLNIINLQTPIFIIVKTDEVKPKPQQTYDTMSQTSMRSGQYRANLDRTQMASQMSDINSRVGFSSQASEYRKAFYHFHRLIMNSQQTVQRYNAEFSRNLNIKIQNVLDAKGLADYFERQLFKMARNPKQLRKNWSEDETLLLLSLMAYFCCLYNEDFMNLVIIRHYSLDIFLFFPSSSNCIETDHYICLERQSLEPYFKHVPRENP